MKISIGFHPHEKPRIAALYWDAFGQKLGRILGPRDKALTFIARVLSPDYAICARDDSGRLLGVVGFKTMHGALVDGEFRDMVAVYGWIGAAWRTMLLAAMERDVENKRFLMDGLFVDPDTRGQGVGSRLLEAVAQEAVARGYSELRLDVIDSNNRARALYERRGFTAIGDTSTGWMRLIFGFRSATAMVRRLD